MISQQKFEDEFSKMINLCGLIVKREAIRMYYDKLKYDNEEAVFKGMEHIIEDPPNKLTLSVLKSHISQTKIGETTRKWNGNPCDAEGCSMGCVSVIRACQSFVFRCNKCRSYNVKSYPYNTPENIFALENRLKEIKKGVDGGNSIFVNRESRIN